MAGVEQANVVDVVGQDVSGRYVIIMVESRRWGADDAQASQLKEKINAYVGFIMDGSLARSYPETAGRPVDIQLNCIEPPTGQFAAIVEHTTAWLLRFGVGFRVHIMSGPLSDAADGRSAS